MNVFGKFKHVDTLVFDIDGVFTNGKLLVTESGELLRTVSTRDGLAIKMAIKEGFQIIIITGGSSQGIHSRFKSLGVQHIYSGIHDKLPVLQDILSTLETTKSQVAYMGDDLPDIEAMKAVGLSAAPQDAVPEVLAVADYISPVIGGNGCVRDLIEKVMRAKDLWPKFD